MNLSDTFPRIAFNIIKMNRGIGIKSKASEYDSPQKSKGSNRPPNNPEEHSQSDEKLESPLEIRNVIHRMNSIEKYVNSFKTKKTSSPTRLENYTQSPTIATPVQPPSNYTVESDYHIKYTPLLKEQSNFKIRNIEHMED